MNTMKIRSGLVLGLFLLLNSFSQTAATQRLPENVTQAVSDFEVLLSADKYEYKRGDRIRLAVKVMNNNPVKEIFVYGSLQFGVRASFRLFRRDAKGNQVPTRFIDTGSELPPKSDDAAAFVKLRPFHFLGTTYRSSIQLLNLDKRGRYKLWVEYRSPIAMSQVGVTPFFGKEMGSIKSNVVWIKINP